MRQTSSGHAAGIIQFSRAATADRKTLYFDTQRSRGTAQAKRYSAFIDTTLQELADSPGIGAPVTNLNRVRIYVAKQSGARNGHRIFYSEFKGGILVLRILHTGRNWLEHITEGEA